MSKLDGNGLWEGSRMIIPEHRRAMNEQHRRERLRSRIYLDDQELERIGRLITTSLQRRVPVTVRMFDEYEPLVVSGIVDGIDRSRGRFKVDGEWFLIGDIEGVADVVDVD